MTAVESTPEPGADERRTPRSSPRSVHERSRSMTAGGLLLGMGLGGFVDGVVIHQILQWHHMGTATAGHDAYPDITVASLEANTRWDGFFHAGTWVLTVVGLALVWQALRRGTRATWRTLVGLLLAGWGAFNLVEGVINHQLLQLHHLRDDLGGPLAWDLAFLAFGAALVAAGWALRRWDQDRGRATSRTAGNS
jgi:uncharacterized membrane protein